jgi:hypothetical protein
MPPAARGALFEKTAPLDSPQKLLFYSFGSSSSITLPVTTIFACPQSAIKSSNHPIIPITLCFYYFKL